MPCRRRNRTIASREVARPQKTEVTVNPATESRKKFFRPQRDASQPVAGIMMAAVTM